MLGELKGFSSIFVIYKFVLGGIYFKVVVVVEVAKDTPADLYFEHLYTLFLQCVESIELDMVLVEFLKFPEDDLFDGFDIIAVKVGLEDAFLEVT